MIKESAALQMPEKNSQSKIEVLSSGLKQAEQIYENNRGSEVRDEIVVDLILKNSKVGDYIAFPIETKADKDVALITGREKTGSIKLDSIQGIDEKHKHIYVEGRKINKLNDIMNITWLFDRGGWKKLPDLMTFNDFEEFKEELLAVIEEKKREEKSRRAALNTRKSSAEERSRIPHPEKYFSYQEGDHVRFRFKGEILDGVVAGYKNQTRFMGEKREAKLIVKIKAEKGGKEDNYVVSVRDVIRKY